MQHLTLSKSGCSSATQSLQATTFPSADNRSSTRCTQTVSGKEFLRCCSSVSVVELGTRSPFLFPVNTNLNFNTSVATEGKSVHCKKSAHHHSGHKCPLLYAYVPPHSTDVCPTDQHISYGYVAVTACRHLNQALVSVSCFIFEQQKWHNYQKNAFII